MEESSTTLREISLEEAIAIAILYQKHGQLPEAEEVYRKVLAAAPDHPHALHYAGVLAHQQGRSEQGIALIQRSIVIDPGEPDYFNNLGIVLRAGGRLDEAADAYRRAIALDPGHVNAHSNLGVVLKAQGRTAEAEAAYRAAIRLNPEHIDALHNLGVLLSGLGRTQEALDCYCKVTTLSPRHPEARTLLALAHCRLGERDKAIQIFEAWLQDEPDHPVARHMLAACSGRDVPPRASDAYVEKVFDGFAASFDVKLGKLLYRAPALVGAVLSDSGLPPDGNLVVLDAGCGTGLCGPLLRPYARRMVGIDLSEGMLAQAREKQTYDELVKGELTEHLRGRPDTYDVIVAADTLVYFGSLEDVTTAAAAALRAGGAFVFTLERSSEAEDASPFTLQVHGRYSHSRDYVERLLTAAGLQRHIVEADLRMESASPVAGLLIHATRPVVRERAATSSREVSAGEPHA